MPDDDHPPATWVTRRSSPASGSTSRRAEWLVLGAICFTAIGALVAVSTRGN
jgi:hypothetical protein